MSFPHVNWGLFLQETYSGVRHDPTPQLTGSGSLGWPRRSVSRGCKIKASTYAKQDVRSSTLYTAIPARLHSRFSTPADEARVSHLNVTE